MKKSHGNVSDGIRSHGLYYSVSVSGLPFNVILGVSMSSISRVNFFTDTGAYHTFKTLTISKFVQIAEIDK